ncbi:tRNA pseudouridine(38-40) synthase TruA [Thermospira aquatica]|uniref:tRNA pseudouridine synthase A n=1 Tax=Thermospira aquatica TaxID=2828656 RepID=A0AAX3BEB1_9SPIR|nr:tRNA pseudouridine(38-40) synthase TruA [Thermospira aquatica]URA10679.1 tRNA pseudouridine(38-40) synthase TruA [Thermospira aquatica]
MVRNIHMILEYDGGKYHGWQRQNGQSTVQGRIEHVLKQMTGEDIELIGASRTDAGVHALGQSANFFCRSSLPIEEMEAYLKQFLPDDIQVISIREAEPRFHARHLAIGKHYRYQIWNGEKKNIFERRYYYQIRQKLDLDAMREVIPLLTGTRDFRIFTTALSKDKSAFKRLDSITMEVEGPKIFLHFKGDSFLHKMVRMLTGTLIQVGLHELSKEDVLSLMQSSREKRHILTAPPHALFLVEVYY